MICSCQSLLQRTGKSSMMDKLIRLGGLIDAGLNSVAMFQEWQARRDLIGETNYLQGALSVEREEIRTLRNELKDERRKAEYYWTLLYGEGFVQDDQGQIHRIDFTDNEEDFEDEENKDEGTEPIELTLPV